MLLIIIIILSVFLLFVPAVLLAIPRTRRSVGSWILAWKIVPVGCFGCLLLSSLFGWLLKQLGDAASWGTLVLALAATWAAIVAVVRQVQRRSAAPGKFNWFPSVAVFLLYAVVVFGMMGDAILLFIRGDYPDPWRGYPFSSEPPLVFEECLISPIYGKYYYRIRFRHGWTVPLMTNTGGRTCFNVYRLRDGRFYLTDKDFDYLVDPVENRVFFLSQLEGRVYAAPLPKDKVISWSNARRQGDRVVQTLDAGVMDWQDTFEAHDVSPAFAGMEYRGRIVELGRFIPAAKRRETPITRNLRPPLPIKRVLP